MEFIVLAVIFLIKLTAALTTTTAMNFLIGKKENELSTSESDPMNPLVFPKEISELILSYLPVKDMIASTQVSKLWNFTVGESLTFKKRVAIRLHFWNKDTPPKEIMKSNRSYEIISISDFKISSTTLKGLRDKAWRSVVISVGKISSQNSFIKMMEYFPTVKDLKILSTNIRELNGSPKLALSELESLVLSDVTLDLFEVLVTHQPALKALSLRFLSCDILSPRRVGEALVEFFKLNLQVNDLEVNYIVTNDLFVVDVSSLFNIKLTSLTIGLDETPKETQGNIEKFIKAHGNSIEHLKLVLHQRSVQKRADQWGYWENSEESSSNDLLMIFNVWNSLFVLKSLSIRVLKNSGAQEDTRELLKHLKQNTNVTSLCIQAMNVSFPNSIVVDFLKLMPNLKSIYITQLTSAVVRYAATNLKALRELSCFSFDGECHQEYIEMKTARNDVNNFIVISDRCAFG